MKRVKLPKVGDSVWAYSTTWERLRVRSVCAAGAQRFAKGYGWFFRVFGVPGRAYFQIEHAIYWAWSDPRKRKAVKS